jgi:hypothetical protein
MRERDWENTPEAIDDWLRWYDSLKPVKLTRSDKAKWLAALRSQEEFEKSDFEKRAKQLEALFSR